MKAKNKKPILREFSFYWLFHFGFHLFMAFVAFGAGLVVIFTEKAIVPGLALCGAAVFAFVNGINGFRELIGSKRRGKYLHEN